MSDSGDRLRKVEEWFKGQEWKDYVKELCEDMRRKLELYDRVLGPLYRKNKKKGM